MAKSSRQLAATLRAAARKELDCLV